MYNIKELYARSYATENEHFFMENELKDYCLINDLKFYYYRKLKLGHQPCWREWKISGPRGKILKSLEDLKSLIDNSWRNRSLI